MEKKVNKWRLTYTNRKWRLSCRVNGETKIVEGFPSYSAAYEWALEHDVTRRYYY
jgi:hypothetical protein